ncbi:hypothetical protein, conserved [Eimeria acervulina]|uniref:Uncharacterized protein n=1 Tax=Eimeria acervulina TaxID=5801 RepID=U6GEJ6_EIMAC|nr:hypothetical protein, conserved [Eimeria acervulina]CDI77763.1 hypothetical protein, conserved [Eimeria acervulina]
MEAFIRGPEVDALEEQLLPKTEKKARATKRLFEAAEANNTDRALALLKDGADPAVEDAAQWSALQWAVVHGNAVLVKELLRYGAADHLVELQQQQQQQQQQKQQQQQLQQALVPIEAQSWQLNPKLEQLLQQEQQRRQQAKERHSNQQHKPPEEAPSAAAAAAAAAEKSSAPSPAAAAAATPQQQEQQQQERPAGDAAAAAAAATPTAAAPTAAAAAATTTSGTGQRLKGRRTFFICC